MTAVAAPLALKRDLLTGTEWTPAQLRDFFHLATEMKAHPDRYRTALAGSMFVLIFEKPSLRTRVTFETGIANLGGSSTFLDHTGARLSEREPVRDIARNLERWVQGIVARVFAQETLDELAANANVPVINALSDRFHPCQALADFFTLEERFGDLRGLKLAYVGDGNNVCHSLLYRWRARRRARSRRHARRLRAGRDDRCRIQTRSPAKPAGRSTFFERLRTPLRAPTPSIRTSGPAWARKRKPPARDKAFSRRIR